MEIRTPETSDTEMINAVASKATEILRKIYKPRQAKSDKARSTPEALTKLVALNNRHIVGVVEYVEKNDHIYFQGLAVEPSRHRQGIARALITRLEKLCTERDLQKLALATIEETGNVQVFERLGFGVVEREQTDQYESDLYDILHIVKMVRIVVRPVQAKQI